MLKHTFKEYIELSKKGDTFEEPIYEDLDEDMADFELYNDHMGVDSTTNVVRVKYLDPLLASPEDESRPRMSRRNDLNEFSYNDKNVVVDPLQLFQTKNVAQPSLSMTQPTIIVPEARTLLMNPNTQHNSIGGLAYSESGKILEIPSGTVLQWIPFEYLGDYGMKNKL